MHQGFSARGNSPFANDWGWASGIPALQYVAQSATPLVGLSAAIIRWIGGGDTVSTIVDGILAAAAVFAITWLVAFLPKLLKAPADRYFAEKGRADELATQLSGLKEARRDTLLLDAVYYLVMTKWPEPGDRLSRRVRTLSYRTRQKQTARFKEISLIFTRIFQASMGVELVIWGIPKARSEMDMNLEVNNNALWEQIPTSIGSLDTE